MALFHTWSGLVFGWLLFAVFATGTAAYFQEEITRWMQPEVHGSVDDVTAAENALDFLGREAPGAKNWFITLPNNRRITTQLFWRSDDPSTGGGYNSADLDPSGAKITTRATSGGYFLYRFHFDLHYMPVILARYLVGIAAMFMLVAILSGVITHKKIFKDFFTLRLGKGQRSWLDAHNVSAVLALPFHLMITFTGLVTLAVLYMPWGIAANYASPSSFYESAFATPPEVERSGNPADLAPVEEMLSTAEAHWNGARPGSISVSNPGDETAVVTITRAADAAIGAKGETLAFKGATGEPIQESLPKGPALQTQSVMIGLHAGRFADWGLRWLYFLSGIGGTIMVGSGLVMWTAKRRSRLDNPARPHFGFRLVERLNLVAITGFSAGIANYFLANRLLPLTMEGRAEWEVNCLFLTLAAVALLSVLRPIRKCSIEMLSVTALLYLAVPVVNAVTTNRGLGASLLNGDYIFAGFDLAMLLLASLFAYATHKLRSRQPAVVKTRPRMAAEART
nr:PepSY-associated TM helix domain-containing protein [Altericroceibacterium endophyticum]